MLILVRVMPNSKKLEIIKLDEKNYRIRLDAPAIEGRANSRLVEVLSDYLDIPKSSIRIVKGLKSRNKIVEII
jgi:uncharacterized protein (TIGR00251 family)